MTDSTSPHGEPADPPHLIRVRNTSPVIATAGAIAAILREWSTAEVHAIGPGVVNQAVKALATAHIYLQDTDHAELRCRPYLHNKVIAGQERTVVWFVVEMVWLEP